MALYRVKARWTGFTGSPGYSIFHFDIATTPNPTDAELVAGEVRSLFAALAIRLPAAVKIQVESAVEVIDETSGQLSDVVTIPQPAAVQGTGTGGFSAATGACITWTTGGVRNGRRVKGRTFLVPLSSMNYDTDGTLTAPALTDIQAAADLLVADQLGFGVYARPDDAKGLPGDVFIVTGARVADKTAVLTSRRD